MQEEVLFCWSIELTWFFTANYYASPDAYLRRERRFERRYSNLSRRSGNKNQYVVHSRRRGSGQCFATQLFGKKQDEGFALTIPTLNLAPRQNWFSEVRSS